MIYEELLELKRYRRESRGFECKDLNPRMFDFQHDIVKWSLRKGSSAIFADTGLGKTIMQLSWSEKVHEHTNKPVLILAPLAVAKQTENDGMKKYGIKVKYVSSQEEVVNGVNITNYDKLHKFDTTVFSGIALDESSILKSFTGKTTNYLIEAFEATPFKLCCTATPSPNDYTELGTTAEFLGVMRRSEMLAEFFINDITSGTGWRLKGHSELKFYEWLSTWSVFISNPKDLGYQADGYELPPLNIRTIMLDSTAEVGYLIPQLAETLSERRKARKESFDDRLQKTIDIINSKPNEHFLIWCDYNYESTGISRAIDEAVEVKGSDTPEHKEKALIGFANDEVKYLVSKPSIAGYGMNWQNCNNMIFCGLSDSFEMFYQAVRRSWRFGQTKPVNVYVIISEAEENVLLNIREKQAKHDEMSKNMQIAMSKYMHAEMQGKSSLKQEYEPTVAMQVM